MSARAKAVTVVAFAHDLIRPAAPVTEDELYALGDAFEARLMAALEKRYAKAQVDLTVDYREGDAIRPRYEVDGKPSDEARAIAEKIAQEVLSSA